MKILFLLQESRYQRLSLAFESAVSIIRGIGESGILQQSAVNMLSVIVEEYQDMATEAPWDSSDAPWENRDANALLTAVHHFARSGLPIQLEVILQSMSELDRKGCSDFPTFLQSVLKLLNIEGLHWPPLEPISSDTVIQLAAAIRFSGQIAVLPESTDAALAMIAHSLMTECDVQTIPQDLLQQLFQVAFLLCNRTMNPSASFIVNITQLFTLWHGLGRQQHFRQMVDTSRTAAVQTGRVLIQRLSQDAASTSALQCYVIRFLASQVSMHLPKMQLQKNAAFVWALHRCAEKYPGAAGVCIQLMQEQLSTAHAAPSETEVKTLRNTFRYCLQHIQAHLHEQQLSTHTGNSFPQPFPHQLNKPETVNRLLLSTGVLLSAKSPALLELISQPGVICGLEALAREFHMDGKHIHGHLMAAYTAIGASLRNSSSSSSSGSNGNLTIPERLTLSLARTLHKQILVLDVRSKHLPEAEDLAQCMTKILDLTFEDRGSRAYHHQLYTLVGVTLRQLVKASMDDDHIHVIPAIQAWIPQLRPIPDVEANPASWVGHVEACASSFRGRHLLVSCGNVTCSRLSGPLDIALATRLCSGCRRVRYCSVDCQDNDWVRYRHAGVCGNGSWMVSTAEDVMVADTSASECAQRLGVATSTRTETLHQLHDTEILAVTAMRAAVEAHAAAQAAANRATEACAAAAQARQTWAAAAAKAAVAGVEADVADVNATFVRNAFNLGQ